MMKQLGAVVCRVQDSELARDPGQPWDERVARLRGAIAFRRRMRALRFGLGWGGLGAAAAAALLWMATPAPLKFTVGLDGQPGVVGDWMSVPAVAPQPLTFSDGSHVLLAANSRARVAGTSPHGAQVIVERGGVDAHVVPREDNKWMMSLGPFDIHVKGTTFQASWDPGAGRFHLRMTEGMVVVSSQCLTYPRAASVGEEFDLVCQEHQPGLGASSQPGVSSVMQPAPEPPPPSGLVQLHPVPAPSANRVENSTLADPPPAAPSSDQAPTEAPAEARPAASASALPSAAALPWQQLADQGQYREAMRLLESSGRWAELCQTLPERELLRLGDVARWAGRSGLAVQVYSSIRVRFANSESAATAAFHIARLLNGPQESARWLETYLQERPSGAYAQEALGRLLEIYSQTGGQAARTIADRYLRQFPSGPHASKARSLLAQ